FEYQFREAGPEIIKDLVQITRRQMIMKDGSAHVRLRRQASPSFSPQALDSWLPAIRRSSSMLLDQVRNEGRMDVARHISYNLPPTVITELFGIPDEDRERFRAWGQPIADFSSGTATTAAELAAVGRRANDALVGMSEYLARLVEERRTQPGADMLSGMIQVEQAGKMSTDEVVANAILLVTAGHLTTTDQISNLVHDLLSHPQEFHKLREDPSLLKSALEEGLRYTPAVTFMNRVAIEDFQLRGRTIKKGQIVHMGLAAANRDPDIFPDPDRFDITRDSYQQKHLSFAFGPHHCLGAGLARRELTVAVEMLLQSLPGLRHDEEQPPKRKVQGLLSRGFDSLPVRW
ncbi:cytochrome P450, partial [Archangium sp.]|uniref:cytochrome P450 n=1 Tax=Archangium sp. TaxID=1872627 RepID=UPI00389A3477